MWLWPRQPGGDGKDRPGNSRQHGLRQSRGLPCQHAVAGADPDCAAREDDRRVREDQSRLLTAAPRSLADETASSGGGFVVLRPQKCTFRSEEHTSELQSLMRISYAVFCLKKKTYATIAYRTEIHINKR